MTYFALSALFNAIICLLLGFFVLFKSKTNSTNKTFFLYSFAIAFWSGGYFLWQVSESASSALLWTKVLTLGSIFIPVFYTQLVYEILGQKKNKYFFFTTYVIAGYFSVRGFGYWLVHGVEPRMMFHYWPVAGNGYKYYLALWFALVIYSTALLVINYKSAHGQRKVQILYFLLASLVGYSGGITNFPLWYGINLAPWGNILVSFFAFILAYAVLKYRILNVKVIKTEAIVLTIFIVLVIDALISSNLNQAIVRVVLVVLFGMVGSQLVKSVFSIEQINKRLERDKKKLEELDRMKDEFLQMATHELNTPITVIQGRLSMALDDDMAGLDQKQKEFFAPVFDDAQRLAHLSKDLLNVTRIDQRRLNVEKVDLDLDELAVRLVSDMNIKSKENGNTFLYRKSHTIIPHIQGDPNKLAEVIMNLLTNANKFTRKGRIITHIDVGQEFLTVSVKDDGIGVSKDDQSRLFDKFYQAGRFDTNNPQEQQGSGLGLYISKSIIELHGGKMWLESEKGKGSTFYFGLPVAPKHAELVHA